MFIHRPLFTRTGLARTGATCAALTCTVIASCCIAPASADEISLAGDFGEPRVIVSAPTDEKIAHLSWPKVVRAADGTLVTAYIAGTFHGAHGGGCPAVSYSTDNGKTFSKPLILKRYGPGQDYTSAGNCALGMADDGAVVLLSMAFNGNKANTVDGWRSTDSGRTWQPADVSKLDHSKTGSVYGSVTHVPGKGLAVFGHYRRPKQSGIWMSWSRDNGKSWGEPKRISDSKLTLVEPAFTYSKDRFIGLIRTPRPYYLQMTSDDAGETWQTEEPGLTSDLDIPLSMPSPAVVADPTRPGVVYALVSERHAKGANTNLKGRVVLWTADAESLQWKKLGSLVRFPTSLGARGEITYPWITHLDGDQWFGVFYCGKSRGASDIYGWKFQIPADAAQ